MLKINNKVWILNSKKTDGRYNQGKIVGIKQGYEHLGFVSKAQFLRDITVYEYQIAYFDVFTKRASIDWINHSYISKDKPTDSTN